MQRLYAMQRLYGPIKKLVPCLEDEFARGQPKTLPVALKNARPRFWGTGVNFCARGATTNVPMLDVPSNGLLRPGVRLHIT